MNELTKRETEVVDLIINGLTTREIAKALFISFKTAETHRNHIMKKWGVHNTAQLVKRAAVPPPIVGWQCPVCNTVNAPWASFCPGVHVKTTGVTELRTDSTQVPVQ